MLYLLIEFAAIGLIGGLLGIFLRNCLKIPHHIFHWWYVILQDWVEDSKPETNVYEPSGWRKFLGFIAYPLGYCIYCSSVWVTFFLCFLWLIGWESLPDWNILVIGILTAVGVEHIVVCWACKFIIWKHPDLDVDE